MGDMNLLKPIAVFEKLFEQKIRLEDRQNDEHAFFSVAVNVLQSCNGSSLVKVGYTEVVCGIKVKVLPEAVDAGHIVCNVELNSLANRSIHPNTTVSKEAQFLSSSLQRLINNVVCPNAAKDLNIYAEDNETQPVGSYVVKLDVVVLYDDGCLLDACVPSALAALLSLRWPKICAVAANGVVEGAASKQYKQCVPKRMQSLSISEWPVTLTFCFIPLTVARNAKGNALPLICQPTKRELSLWDTDAGPGTVTLSSSSGRVIEMSMTNAFLPSFCEDLSVQDAKVTCPSKSTWRTLFDIASAYSLKMKAAIQSALQNAPTDPLV